MSSNSEVSGGGMSLAGVVTVVFVILKLVHVIDWPWVWVLSPLWISFLLFIAVIILIFVGTGIAALIKWATGNNR